ncbi:hypothetical protein [Dysgonomonas termitidis]|uniref:Uncharacterized protein n=1 Tax=Dysgonomonas termitidis TaxID=1516126 RepID=A0ABV9L1R9_9BACT
MKKKFLHADKAEILLAVLLMAAVIILFRCCTRNEGVVYADSEDQEQTIEMIQFLQSEGRFAVEENGHINIRP